MAAAASARGWIDRLQGRDGLSRLVRAATGSSVELTRAEFAAVRGLFEDGRIWEMLASGTTEELVKQIAACLPPTERRSDAEARQAAEVIARGLVEFVVAELDTQTFQQVLLARLEHFRTEQATALDDGLAAAHADLYLDFVDMAEAGEMLAAQRFSSIVARLRRLELQLPPRPAGRQLLRRYLTALISWLDHDAWPLGQQPEGPVLAPAAIERALWIARRDRRVPADDIVDQAGRLVVLGGPGAGKTWLAMRTVRRGAQAALAALDSGQTVEDVEVPLYTTAAGLLVAEGSVRELVVSAAVDRGPDLGGKRATDAVRQFFLDRNDPTLLVIDSLDEAPGSSERLRQVDTLPWRVMLTSRPSAWNHQLTLDEENSSHVVGELQPLSYPDDVNGFIDSWFSDRPERGASLQAQIAARPELQGPAAVPLLLAFYCIVGDGDDSLPVSRRDLHTKVVNRLLLGGWRRSTDDSGPDLAALVADLQRWAWNGAVDHPDSGVGVWPEDVLTPQVKRGPAEEKALDHVASPSGRRDPDTGLLPRRFIHRAIREHLVAEYIAGLPVDQATLALLPHLWYDPDWEVTAPAAVAAHPRRDEVLAGLLRAASGAAASDDLLDVVGRIDGGDQARGLLACLASETGEADWSPLLASLIGAARTDLARTSRYPLLERSAHWSTSNPHVARTLLERLDRAPDHWEATGLALLLSRLEPPPEDRRRARSAILARLETGGATSLLVRRLHTPLRLLAPVEEDREETRTEIVNRLSEAGGSATAARSLADVLVDLPVADEEKAVTRESLIDHIVAGAADTGTVASIARAVARLDPTAEQRRTVRGYLGAQLMRVTSDWDAEELTNALLSLQSEDDETAETFAALMALATSPIDEVAAVMVDAAASLGPTLEQRRTVREHVLRLLRYVYDRDTTVQLLGLMTALSPTSEERAESRRALAELLAGVRIPGPGSRIAHTIIDLAENAGEQNETARALVDLTIATHSSEPPVATDIARMAADHLDLTAEQREKIRPVLVGGLASATDAGDRSAGDRSAAELVKLAQTPDERTDARALLVDRFARTMTERTGTRLVQLLLDLATTDDEKATTFHLLLDLCVEGTEPDTLLALADALAQLARTDGERHTTESLLIDGRPGVAIEAPLTLAPHRAIPLILRVTDTSSQHTRAFPLLLNVLATATDSWTIAWHARHAVQIADTQDERAEVRYELARHLRQAENRWGTEQVAHLLVRLAVTSEERTETYQLFTEALSSLAGEDHAFPILVHAAGQLDLTIEQQRELNETVVTWLCTVTDEDNARHLVDALAHLAPDAANLKRASSWARPPTPHLLQQVRRNSLLDDWLDLLPHLAWLNTT